MLIGICTARLVTLDSLVNFMSISLGLLQMHGIMFLACVTENLAQDMDFNAGCVVGVLKMQKSTCLNENMKIFRRRTVCDYKNISTRVAVTDGAET